MRMFLILMIAMLVAGGTGLYLMQSRQAPEAPVAEESETPAPDPKAEIFVPVASLAAGALIRPEDLRTTSLDEGAVSAEMIRADDDGEDLLYGAVARQPLAEGMPIARSATIQPGERGFLAAVLEPGKRAIAVPVSETSAVGGHVLPGDRVDLIMTYQVSSDDANSERDMRASETLLGKRRVLAIDRELESGTREARVGNTITLEVTSKQAEVISLARRLGDLSLVLNSLRDDDPTGEVDEIAGVNMLQLARSDTPARDPTPEAVRQNSRTMTIDSDISSLLSLHFGIMEQPEGEISAAPEEPAQVSRRVRVVRGIAVSEVDLSASGPAEPLSGDTGETAE